MSLRHLFEKRKYNFIPLLYRGRERRIKDEDKYQLKYIEIKKKNICYIMRNTQFYVACYHRV